MTDGWREVSIGDLGAALDAGRVSAAELVADFVAAIRAEDGDFNAVAFRNPDAGTIAADLDRERAAGRPRGPLHGVPLLVKDNLDTADGMMTSAGSLALDGSMAPSDSHVVARLRAAGAVLLGKTNLSEWANFRSTRSSSGWSSRGGQVRNAHAVDRTPGGSSSGSGVAAARGFAAGAIGTETDGSVVGPSAMNGIVGIKPTVGLVSRAGIVPIAASQDTAGPMARCVADAAVLLTAIAGTDPADPATAEADRRRAPDYTAFLDPDALSGARIGVPRAYAGYHEGVDRVFEDALATLRAAGAEVIDDVSLPSREEIRASEVVVMATEFKAGLNAYLAGLGPQAPVRSLAEVIAFNESHAARTMPHFGQELLIRAEATDGLDDPAYRHALATCRWLSRDEGIDAALREHRLDALAAPTAGAAWAIDMVNGDNRLGGSSTPAAVAGYAAITVPMGGLHGLPLGLSLFAGAWSEPRLIALAHAFEAVSQVRVTPGPARRLLV